MEGEGQWGGTQEKRGWKKRGLPWRRDCQGNWKREKLHISAKAFLNRESAKGQEPAKKGRNWD